jgi:hypothetical protein
MIFAEYYQKARKICYMKNFGKVKKNMLSEKNHIPDYMNKANYAKNRS